MVSTEDFLAFCDEALEAMAAMVAGLGDELANRRPALPGANSPYAIVTHCLGVTEFWAGHVVAGLEVQRDRAAEFVAVGPVDDLVGRLAMAQAQLRRDLAGVEPAAPVRGRLPADDRARPLGRSQGGALLHLYDELARHRGHLELTVDVLRAGLA